MALLGHNEFLTLWAQETIAAILKMHFLEIKYFR